MQGQKKANFIIFKTKKPARNNMSTVYKLFTQLTPKRFTWIP